MTGITPSQTVGPYFAIGMAGYGDGWSATIGDKLVTPDVSGERIRIEGRVLDGTGQPVTDAMVEIWQADATGRYAHPADTRALPNTAFKGYGRACTDERGAFGFETIKPGAVPGPDDKMQAPHIAVALFARGMLRHCWTRIYFADETANATDPILALVPSSRRATLMARRDGAAAIYRFDIHLQGEDETVFFDM